MKKTNRIKLVPMDAIDEKTEDSIRKENRNPEEILLEKEEPKTTLAEVIGNLKRDERDLIELLQICEGNESEAARRLGVSKQAVAKRVIRLRKMIWPIITRLSK